MRESYEKVGDIEKVFCDMQKRMVEEYIEEGKDEKIE